MGKLGKEKIKDPNEDFTISWLREFHNINTMDFSDEELSSVWNLVRFHCFGMQRVESVVKNVKIK